VRIWQSPRVKVGGRYALGPGAFRVTALKEISLADITPDLARRSGFAGVVDLLKTAKHGPGERVYLVEFEYEKPESPGLDQTNRSSVPDHFIRQSCHGRRVILRSGNGVP